MLSPRRAAKNTGVALRPRTQAPKITQLGGPADSGRTSSDANMPHPVNTRLVIGPNASMSVRQAVWFIAWMCMVSLLIGGFFAWRGFWPILPFAGLELAALAAALAVSLRRNRYREVVDFDDEAVRVEVGEVGRGVADGRRESAAELWRC